MELPPLDRLQVLRLQVLRRKSWRTFALTKLRTHFLFIGAGETIADIKNDIKKQRPRRMADLRLCGFLFSLCYGPVIFPVFPVFSCVYKGGSVFSLLFTGLLSA